ncbi:MAG: glycosyltransferase [Thermoproteota archaeon]|nr:glycosyltransferase [Thermoproteota archaeon]
MRVYFAPCGVGLGHVGRCVPIAKRLHETEAKILFSTYRDGVNYVRQEGFLVREAPPISFKVKPDGTIDFRQTAANPGPFFASFTLLKQINAEIRVMKSFRPDIVVSDSRVSPLIAAKLLGIPPVSILNQFQIIVPRRTRFLRLAKFADASTLTIIGKIWTAGVEVLIPDFPPPYTISKGNLHIPNSYRKHVKLIGPILRTHPNELASKEKLRKKLDLETGKPLIFVPISGPLKERSYLIKILQQIFVQFPNEYQVVMSLGYPNSSTTPRRRSSLTVYNWIPNRFEYLKASDLVIARAGHGTLAQCICYGKPMILIPTPSHTEQLNNAAKAVELGIAKVVAQEKLSALTLLEAVQKMLEGKQFQKRTEQIQREVLGLRGLETAVKIIMEIAEGDFSNVSS